MRLDSNNKCLIATPLMHLPDVADFVQSHGDCFIVDETISYDNLSKCLRSSPDIRALLVNPNAQGFLIDKKIISESSLLTINTCSTGLNHIDLVACLDHGVNVLSLKKDYELINYLPSTSELAFGMMLALFRNFPSCSASVLKNDWNYKPVMGHQLAGSTIGVLGFGRLGKIFCEQLSGFQTNVLVCENSDTVHVPSKYSKVDIDTLFSSTDAVVLHIHSTDENKNLINHKLLSKTKKGFYLINTSRGDIVNEQDISKLLESGHLGGYATDVLATEFSDLNSSPVLNLYKQSIYNIVITPHVGGMTFEGQTKAFLYALNKFSF